MPSPDVWPFDYIIVKQGVDDELEIHGFLEIKCRTRPLNYDSIYISTQKLNALKAFSEVFKTVSGNDIALGFCVADPIGLHYSKLFAHDEFTTKKLDLRNKTGWEYDVESVSLIPISRFECIRYF